MENQSHVALSAVLLLSLGVSCAAAQTANTRTIDQYLCKDVMREHGDNRDVTIAFLHGFLLGNRESRLLILICCTSRPAPLLNIVSIIPAKSHRRDGRDKRLRRAPRKVNAMSPSGP